MTERYAWRFSCVPPAGGSIVCNFGEESTEMSVSRRSFIRSAAVCALTTGVLLRTPLAAFGQAAGGGAMDFPIPYEATTTPLFHFTRATFEPYLKGIFFAAGGRSRMVELQLVEIRGYAPPSGALLATKAYRRTDCFSLLFRSAAPLSQLSSIHKLEHAALGKFDLFMTESVGRGDYFYEAVINHVAS